MLDVKVQMHFAIINITSSTIKILKQPSKHTDVVATSVDGHLPTSDDGRIKVKVKRRVTVNLWRRTDHHIDVKPTVAATSIDRYTTIYSVMIILWDRRITVVIMANSKQPWINKNRWNTINIGISVWDKNNNIQWNSTYYVYVKKQHNKL